MGCDVFISHSRQDKLTADAVCNRLESARVRCWIAPRDVIPGTDWTESILNAIGSCQIVVLVFSDSMTSLTVRRPGAAPKASRSFSVSDLSRSLIASRLANQGEKRDIFLHSLA
jgi:hypothetical protein